jgi:hypothetical protein
MIKKSSIPPRIRLDLQDNFIEFILRTVKRHFIVSLGILWLDRAVYFKLMWKLILDAGHWIPDNNGYI